MPTPQLLGCRDKAEVSFLIGEEGQKGVERSKGPQGGDLREVKDIALN